MAVEWGGWSGHLRVGIDVFTDGYDTNTPSINVYVDIYIECDSTWDFDDAQTMNYSGNIGGTTNYYNSLGPGQQMYIGRHTIGGQGQSYGGGPNYSFTAQVTGHYQGATPWHTRNFTLPARPPNIPTAPGIGVDSVTSNSARIVVYAADGRGSGIVEYQTQVDDQNTFASPHATFGGGTGTVTGLAPATTYYARSRARNGVGWGAWSAVPSFTTGATVPGVPGSLANSNVDQTTATLSWTAPNNGGSAISGYDVQLATDSGFTANLQTLAYAASPAALTGLVPGTQYYARVRAKNGVGPGAYTAATTFTTLAGTPSIVVPVEAGTYTDGAAAVTVTALGIAADRTITAELSQDSTFATGVITLTLNPTGRSGNDRYTLSDAAKFLKTGTWYARSKVTNNTSGYVTPWSTTVSFTQSHQPSASVQSPTAGQTLEYIASPTLTWKFTDAAHPIDLQSAYRLQIERNSTGELIYDSQKTLLASTPSNTSVSVSVPLDASLKNVGLRWRVMVWDKGDTASAWTGYGLFTLSDPPVVTLTAPDPIIPVDNGAPTFSWNLSIPSGGQQKQAVIAVFNGDDNVLVWTETVQGASTSITPPVVILRNEADYYWTVDVTDTTLLTGSATGNFSTSYQAPDTITYGVDAADADEMGFVSIDWSNANPDDLFAAWKVYRRILAGQWELIATISNQNIRTYRDYMLVAGQSYSYSVTQVAIRSGTLLESSVGYFYDADGVEQAEHRYFDIDLNHYWIINSDNPDMSVRLVGVTDDSSTLEFEQESYTIIGRGRHVDYGDELGYTGTLECQVRLPERPSSFRQRIEDLRRAKETYHLRTPFGRLFKIAIGNLDWSPLGGVGNAEMGDMSIPYEQVN